MVRQISMRCTHSKRCTFENGEWASLGCPTPTQRLLFILSITALAPKPNRLGLGWETLSFCFLLFFFSKPPSNTPHTTMGEIWLMMKYFVHQFTVLIPFQPCVRACVPFFRANFPRDDAWGSVFTSSVLQNDDSPWSRASYSRPITLYSLHYWLVVFGSTWIGLR